MITLERAFGHTVAYGRGRTYHQAPHAKLAHMLERAGTAYPKYSYREKSERNNALADVIATTIPWIEHLTNEGHQSVLRRIADEIERADQKHNGWTPLNPEMSDEDRAAILWEELGEVARCLTPDANTPTGHAGELVDELTQVGAMAAAWLQHELTKSNNDS